MSKEAVMRAVLTALLVSSAVGCQLEQPSSVTAEDISTTIETTYAAAGPWAVSQATVNSSAGAAVYQLFYPTALGQNGFHHPVLSWGNGTGATPAQYSILLTHLASWGFVVIASTSGNVGTGAEMLAAEDYLVAANGQATSPFFGVLDLTAIGVLGHSQGAGGTLRAMTLANATGSTHLPIRAAMPIELPAQRWVCFGSTDAGCMSSELYDGHDITQGAIFFVNGSKDTLISPSTQSATTTGEQSIAAFYAAVPAGVAKAKATLTGADHNDIQDACSGLSCAGVGPTGYLGYLTAWMRYRLLSDTTARTAFAGATIEINQNTHWANQAESSLP
jgi:hypothetical protein